MTLLDALNDLRRCDERVQFAWFNDLNKFLVLPGKYRLLPYKVGFFKGYPILIHIFLYSFMGTLDVLTFSGCV